MNEQVSRHQIIRSMLNAIIYEFYQDNVLPSQYIEKAFSMGKNVLQKNVQDDNHVKETMEEMVHQVVKHTQNKGLPETFRKALHEGVSPYNDKFYYETVMIQ